MEPPIPANKELYNKVKKMANKKFTSPSGIYRSSWIVNTYKKMGGRYRGSKPKNSGLKRWYKEKWIDLNSKSGKIIGYQNFFKKSSTKTKSLKSKNKSKKFPFCRPYLNSKTPRTIKEISKKSLTKAKRLKSKIKNRGNVQIGRGKDFDERAHLEKLKKEYQEILKDTNLPEYTRVSHQNRINIIQEILTDTTDNSDLLKKYKKLITKKYISRPGIKEKRKEYKKEYYSRPEIKEKQKEYSKEYYSNPEIKEKKKEYYSRPEIKEKKKEYQKEYDSRPGIKEKRKEYSKEYYKKKIAVESLLNLKTQNFQSGSGKPQFKGSKSKKSLIKAKKFKSKIKNRGNVQIGRGKDFDERAHLEKLKKEYQEILKDTNLPEYTRVSHQNRINIIQEILTDTTDNSDLLKKYKKLITKKYISRPGIKEKRKEYKKEYRKKKIAVESLLNLKTQNFQSGSGKPQFKGSKSKIMVQVPKNVKKWAEYAFKLKKIGFKGAKETGWKRAKQLASKTEIPIEDLRYMRNWFARHIITSYPTFKKWQKAGRPKDSSWFNKRGIISWITWAGDAGFKWVNSQKNINLLNKHFNKSYKALFRKKSAKIRSSF